ncbi:MAG: tRNA-dihydrouridine synthase family protein [Kiritimatiellae bacterium]|nr:tRNA-dihydrouridine synthase family protein [Kiritimatiellia bacterium]
MKYVLAPLADYTDAPFRLMCFEGGADMAYTEMVSAAALAHAHGPSERLLVMMPGEGPVGCQIFGSSESDVAAAARKVSGRGFSELNLNAGCPMKTVTRSGAGAKLLDDPAKIGRLLKAMKENTDLPVTLKTRLGPHPARTTVYDILGEAERAGASGISIHARYASQLHGGEVHLDELARVVETARIPVTGNGSVRTPREASGMSATGVSAIMIGRGALADPSIFRRLREGGDVAAPDGPSLCAKHLGYILKFREMLAARHPGERIPSPDAFASVKMHRHLFRYFGGLPGAAAMRARLNSVRTVAEIYDIITSYANGRHTQA